MENKKKYPISKHNKQCLGPCYEPGTWVINPITLQYITNFDEPFCPTNMWTYKDPNTGKKTDLALDVCYVPTHTKDISKSELEMNILVPKIDFDSTQFLNIYYEITSFEDTLEWIDKNPKASFNTKLRLLECSWKAYGEKTNTLDDRLISLYQEIIKKRWIKFLYPALKEYISISNNKPSFDTSGNSHDSPEPQDKITKINFLISQYTTNNKINKFLVDYLAKFKKQWADINNHEKNMIKFLISWIIQDIKQK